MKKILYSVFAAIALSAAFVACDDDDIDVDRGSFSTTPEIAAAGVYSGTYTRVEDGTTDTTTAQGTVTLEATDSAYCADVTFSAPDLGLDAKSVTNIAHANDGFVFENSSSTNGIGAAFAGRIDGGWGITANFSIVQKEGRKSHTYNYTFKGSKILTE